MGVSVMMTRNQNQATSAKITNRLKLEMEMGRQATQGKGQIALT